MTESEDLNIHVNWIDDLICGFNTGLIVSYFKSYPCEKMLMSAAIASTIMPFIMVFIRPYIRKIL